MGRGVRMSDYVGMQGNFLTNNKMMEFLNFRKIVWKSSQIYKIDLGSMPILPDCERSQRGSLYWPFKSPNTGLVGVGYSDHDVFFYINLEYSFNFFLSFCGTRAYWVYLSYLLKESPQPITTLLCTKIPRAIRPVHSPTLERIDNAAPCLCCSLFLWNFNKINLILRNSVVLRRFFYFDQGSGVQHPNAGQNP